MGKFEDRLWRQLVRDHGADLAQAQRRKRSRRGPRVLAGTTLGLAGIGTAIALILGAASSSPAFAVTQNQDGSVSVTLQAINAIPGANARLHRMGLRVRLVQVKASCQAVKLVPVKESPYARAWRAANAVAQARIEPGKIPPGKTLVVAAWRHGSRVHLVPAHWTTAEIPACLPVPLPPPACGGNIALSQAPPMGRIKFHAGHARALRLVHAMVVRDQKGTSIHLKPGLAKQAPVRFRTLSFAGCKRRTSTVPGRG